VVTVLAAIALLMLFVSVSVAAVVAVVMTGFAVWQPWLTRERNARRQALANAVTAYETVSRSWLEGASGRAAVVAREEAKAEFERYKSSLIRAREVFWRAAKETRETQLIKHLEDYSIADAEVSGLGQKRKQTLASHHIYAAAHLSFDRLYPIPGFGEGLITALLQWKEVCIGEFEPDWNVLELLDIHQRVAERDARMQDTITGQMLRISELLTDAERQRGILGPEFGRLAVARAQAEADYGLVKWPAKIVAGARKKG
jgi:DNA-binding helix-hairpin-helix protein with protein kinase domain